MRRTLLAIVLSAFSMTLPMANSQTAKHVTLASLRDRQRVLLVFANGDNQLAETQLTIAAKHGDGFRQRDLLLVGLSGSNDLAPTAMLSSADDAAARKRFDVHPGQFTVILIGKDGGEKMRSNQPIPWERLQQTIDAMPMRRDEMQGHAR